jgi:hypothetical protein
MDNVTMIRIVAGIVAVVLLVIIISRRKRMAAMKRIDTKRK